MVYVLGGFYNAKQYTPIVLTEESKILYKADLLKFEIDVLGHTKLKRSYLTHAMGNKLPEPDPPYEFDCPVKAENFYNFMYTNAGIIISESVVELIEDMEPGVHQYFPVNFIMKSGPQPKQQYYLLNVCVSRKTLNFEKSRVFKAHNNEDVRWYFQGEEYAVTLESQVPKLDPPYDLFVDKSALQGHTLWREHGFYQRGAIFATDTFYERALALGDLGPLEIENYAGEG